MHVIDIEVSRELEKCRSRRLQSEGLELKDEENTGRQYMWNTSATLTAVNEALNQIQAESPVPRLLVDYFSKESSNVLKLLRSRDEVCDMIEARNYGQVDYVFWFMAAFKD